MGNCNILYKLLQNKIQEKCDHYGNITHGETKMQCINFRIPKVMTNTIIKEMIRKKMLMRINMFKLKVLNEEIKNGN